MPESLGFDPIVEAQRQWRAHWGASAVASMGAVTSLMRVEQILTARLNAVLKPWSLTFPRYEALMLLYLSRSGSLPLGKLGQRLQVHPTSVTSLVDGLERLSLARRERHENDRRTTLASITKEGRSVAEHATQALNDIRFGTTPLAAHELDMLFETLRRIRVAEGDFAEDQ